MNKQQLASKIWAAANGMRSKIEASEYKDYILGFIFYKFLSEQEVRFLKKQGATEKDIMTVNEDSGDAPFVRENIGYFISYDNLFSTWFKKGSDFTVENVRDGLSAFDRLINPTHEKVFKDIFKTLETGLGKLGADTKAQNKAVRSLVELINDIPMDDKQDYDVLGFIYEYLISNFAANAGKKAGEFYTPHEVSILMSEIIAEHLKDKNEIKIYDPTSGSGSLLINIGQSIAKHVDDKNKIKYYAQELKENTYNLTRMNLVMRGILPDNIVTRCGDTLEDDWPYFDDNDKENTYEPLTNLDAVVSNPPYSQPWDPSGKKSDPRFNGYGLAPKSKADYAFLLHDLYHLRAGGIMTIVLPHGVLFRGGEEGEIRKNLIENNNIDAIIGLPSNIFFGTGIPTIVMVLKKNRKDDDVLIIDASKGFIKDGKNNKLRARDIKKIVDVYNTRADVDSFSRKVTRNEIRDNSYNLNIPRYVDSSEKSENIDIYATMFGGIPKKEIKEKCGEEFSIFNSLENQLFTISDTPYVNIVTEDIRKTIESNEQVIEFRNQFSSKFASLHDYLFELLIKNIDLVSTSRAETTIADDIFERMEDIPLIDKYEAYQILDDEWKTISADLEMIQTEGNSSIKQVDPKMVLKKKNSVEVEVQDGYIGHIIPFELIQKEYLSDLLTKIKDTENELSNIQGQYEELIESIPEEDRSGDFLNEDNTAFVTKAINNVAKQYKKGKTPEPGSTDEILMKVFVLMGKEKDLKSDLKQYNDELVLKTKAKLESLSESEQYEMLAKKWISPIIDEINKLPDALINALCSKITKLSSKYSETMLDLSNKIEETEKELTTMLDDLTGDDFDMKGLEEFKKLLGGGKND